MKTFRLYIGSDNDTHELNIEVIRRICSKNHDGFTLQLGQGYWEGSAEDTAIVTICDDSRKIRATMAELKSELNQDAIGFQLVAPMQFA